VAKPAGRSVSQQLVEHSQPGILVRGVEVVGGHPGGVDGKEPPSGEVGQRAKAAGALEHHVDHLRGDAEVAQRQHRPADGHRLQRGR
jgi:hypothetical protein